MGKEAKKKNQPKWKNKIEEAYFGTMIYNCDLNLDNPVVMYHPVVMYVRAYEKGESKLFEENFKKNLPNLKRQIKKIAFDGNIIKVI